MAHEYTNDRRDACSSFVYSRPQFVVGWPAVASLGLLLGLGVLSKVSVAVMALPAGLALLYAAWRREGRTGPALRRALVWGLLVGLGAAAVSGWWFARNALLYGDATGWAFILRTNALREGPLTPAVLCWLARGLFRSFWLGWIGIELPAWVYAGLLGVCLLALAGLARLFLRRGNDFSRSVILALLAVQILAVLASLLKWTATALGTDQARLLYPALPAFYVFLALGLAQWWPARRERWLPAVALPLLVLAALVPWTRIAPVYAPPAKIAAADLASRAAPAAIHFGDALRLAGYRLETGRVRPGETVRLTMVWEALRPISADLWLTLSLEQDPEQPLVTKDGSPSAGRDTTDRWQPGALLLSEHRLRVPAEAPPGRYRLWAGVHPFGTWEWLPAGADGSLRVELGQVDVAP